MKFFSLLLAVPLFSLAGFAQDVKPETKTPEKIYELPRGEINIMPKLLMQDAMKIMENYLARQNTNTSEYFLSSVKTGSYGQEKNKRSVWYFSWMHKSGALGNYISIIIDMDKNIIRLPSM